jgi:hypothetical protein
MNRDEQICVHGVGAGRALDQASPRRGRGDQQHGLLEAGVEQTLVDVAG